MRRATGRPKHQAYAFRSGVRRNCVNAAGCKFYPAVVPLKNTELTGDGFGLRNLAAVMVVALLKSLDR